MLFFSVLSLGLLALDYYTDYLDSVRSVLSIVVTPIVVTADYPARTAILAQETFASQADMRAEIRLLKQDQLLLL